MVNELFGEPAFGQECCYYVARIEQQEKDYFLGGQGRRPHLDSYGQRVPQVRRVGLFRVCAKQQALDRVVLQEGITPCYPAVGASGDLFFHGYRDDSLFRHGLIHCLNRPTQMFRIKPESITLKRVFPIPTDKGQDPAPAKLDVLSTAECNYFASPSPDGKRLIFFSSPLCPSHLFYVRM